MNATSIPQNMKSATAPAASEESSPLGEMLVKPMARYNLALEPQSFDAGWKVAEMVAKLRLCGVTSPEDAYARILTGRAIGLPAMASVQGIALIYQQKQDSFVPCMYAKLKVALLLSRSDVIEYIRPVELTDKKAVWVGKRVGQPEVPYEFTWEMAERAELVGRGMDKEGKTKNNYDRHPIAMLSWRAAGRLADIIGGDVMNGIASREDVTEDEERGETTPARGTVPETVKASVPARDWAKEAGALKDRLTAAVSTNDHAAMKDVRAAFKTFETEAPVEFSQDVLRFYNMVKSETKKADPPPKDPGANPTATAAAQRAAQAARTGAASPATASTAAPKAAEYLPPNQRGDSYEGPGHPPPPVG